jgi:hypothetical protein
MPYRGPNRRDRPRLVDVRAVVAAPAHRQIHAQPAGMRVRSKYGAAGLVKTPGRHLRMSDLPAFRSVSLGARSSVLGFRVVGVQPVEELPDRTLGSEHVKGHMLPMLRNDLVFALGF